MNWDRVEEVWGEFLAFMDRVVQWLEYVFGVTDKWPPEDFEDINAKK